MEHLKTSRHRNPCGRCTHLLPAPGKFHPQTDDTMQQLAAAGVPADMVRLSCGLENAQDLIDDIAQALEAIR